MGIARLSSVLSSLLDEDSDGANRDGCRYPAHLPIALVERASMPDQRIIEGTLADIQTALESVGEQRPPGMLIVGWAVLALWGKGDVEVLHVGVEEAEEEKDERRVQRWLSGEGWRVREGLDAGWERL
jgi:uroporphyrin-III C-methyltransferase